MISAVAGHTYSGKNSWNKKEDDVDSDKGIKNNHIKGSRCSAPINDALI